MKYVSYLDGNSEFLERLDWDSLIKKLILENYKDDWTFCDVGSCDGYYSNFFNSLRIYIWNKIYDFR